VYLCALCFGVIVLIDLSGTFQAFRSAHIAIVQGHPPKYEHSMNGLENLNEIRMKFGKFAKPKSGGEKSHTPGGYKKFHF
jgi:hypothetical protein